MPSKKLQTTFLDFFLLSSQLLTYWWYMKLKEWSSTSNYCTHSCISVWQPFLCFAILTKQRGSNISHQVLIIINWYIPHYLHHMFTIMFNDVNIIGMYLPPSTMRCFWNIIHREKGWGTLYQHILSFFERMGRFFQPYFHMIEHRQLSKVAQAWHHFKWVHCKIFVTLNQYTPFPAERKVLQEN